MALALSLERNTSLRSLNIDGALNTTLNLYILIHSSSFSHMNSGNDRIQDPVMTAIMTLVERNKASARSLRPP